MTHPPGGPDTPPPPAGPKTGEELLPIKDVAALWHCSVDHVYDLIAHRKLRTVQLGLGRAKTRIPASALAEYINAHSTKPRKNIRAA